MAPKSCFGIVPKPDPKFLQTRRSEKHANYFVFARFLHVFTTNIPPCRKFFSEIVPLTDYVQNAVRTIGGNFWHLPPFQGLACKRGVQDKPQEQKNPPDHFLLFVSPTTFSVGHLREVLQISALLAVKRPRGSPGCYQFLVGLYEKVLQSRGPGAAVVSANSVAK